MKCDLEFCTKYLQAWLNAMLDKDEELMSAWFGLHKWTKVHMDKVLYPLALDLGYNNKYGTSFQKEYYRVDFTLYNYYEQSIWTLDYAVEHENEEFELGDNNSIKSKGWFDEFAKLLPLKCAKARVIIGYDLFKDKEAFIKKIKRCADLLNDKRIKDSIADGSIFLIVFPRTSYIKSINCSNGLLHIVHFYKDNAEWKTEDITEQICNEESKKRLISVYKIIADKY